MLDKKSKIKKFNDVCKCNEMFTKFTNKTDRFVPVNSNDLEKIYKGNDSLMGSGVDLNVGFFSGVCKKSINKYKKLISKYPNIIKNNTIDDPADKKDLNDFLNKEKGDWGGYLKHRKKLESKEKNNKNLSEKDKQLSEFVKEMNENKKIIAEGMCRLIIKNIDQASSNAPKELKKVNSIQRPNDESSGRSVTKIVANNSNASQNRETGHSPSYNSDKLNPNIPAQSRNGSLYPSNNHIGPTPMASSSYSNLNAQDFTMTMQSQYEYRYPSNNYIGSASMASSSYFNLNAQNQYMAMQSQYGYQPPTVGHPSGGSFRPPVARSDRDSGASSSYNNSGWPNSNVTIHPSQNGPNPLKKQSVNKESAVTASPPGAGKIRRNPSDRGKAIGGGS